MIPFKEAADVPIIVLRAGYLGGSSKDIIMSICALRSPSP